MANAITWVRIILLIPLFWLLTDGPPGRRWLALALFLLAGLTDILDGRIARKLGQASALGGLLDLAADRLLTLTAVLGLIAGQTLVGPMIAAGAILIARDITVASLGEALPGQLDIRVTAGERVKIALQFLGFGLLIAPPVRVGPFATGDIGDVALALSATLACATLLDYAARARRAFAGAAKRDA